MSASAHAGSENGSATTKVAGNYNFCVIDPPSRAEHTALRFWQGLASLKKLPPGHLQGKLDADAGTFAWFGFRLSGEVGLEQTAPLEAFLTGWKFGARLHLNPGSSKREATWKHRSAFSWLTITNHSGDSSVRRWKRCRNCR